jgi:hypothetical protein
MIHPYDLPTLFPNYENGCSMTPACPDLCICQKITWVMAFTHPEDEPSTSYMCKEWTKKGLLPKECVIRVGPSFYLAAGRQKFAPANH